MTGSVTADGLTVDGASEIRSTLDATLNITSTAFTVNSGDVYGSLNFVTEDGSVASGRKNAATIQAINAGGSGSYCDLDFYTSAGTGATNTKSLKIAANGDISFYEDTGTTPKLFWDASAESLDLTGTGGLDVNTATGSVNIQAGNASADIALGVGSPSTANKVVVTAGGDVGIGTSSPDSPLEIQAATNSSSDTTYLKLYNAGENVGHIDFENGNGSLARITGTKEGAGASANDGILTFSTAFDTTLSERMRLDSSGNVGIGTSSPDTGLEVATTNYTFSGTTYDIYGLFGDTSGGVRLGADSSNDDSVIGTTGTNNLQFVTYNGSAWGSRMTLDNTGKVGIGTDSPNQLLHLSANGPVLALGSSGASDPRIDFYDQGTTNIGAGIFFDQDADSLKILRTVSGSATDGIILNSSGNVGIGVLDPSAYYAENLVVGATDQGGITIECAATEKAYLMFAKGTVGNAAYRGYLGYDHDIDSLTVVSTGSTAFHSGTSQLERMRIDSSGNLLVGQTSNDSADTGHIFNPIGVALHIRDGGVPLVAVRQTSDGELIQLKKDTAVVGSIGTETSNSDLYIGNGDTAIMFHDGADAIFPHNASTNAGRDAAIDIGYSTYRFKDLYLSGGVYLGGTGAANKLEDYEEGTCTITIGRRLLTRQ